MKRSNSYFGNPTYFVACCALLSALCCSCGTQAPKGQTYMEDVLDEYKSNADEPVENAVPDFVNKSLLTRWEARFDVSVNRLSAKTFFLSLVSGADTNIVAHPGVKGKITLELKNVTVNEVLSVVKDIYGYEYKFENNIYTIYPAELRTEVFPINYIDIQRLGISDTSVAIGEIYSNSSSGSRGNSGSRNSGGANSGSSIGNSREDENSCRIHS